MLTSIEIVALTLVFVEDHARLASRHTEKQKKMQVVKLMPTYFLK